MIILGSVVADQGQESVSSSVVVAELDFLHLRGKVFDDGTHLTPAKMLTGNIFQQSDHR